MPENVASKNFAPENELSDLLPDAAWIRTFRRQLNRWYAQHARDLPWRRSQDPFHVWVSEIMLQQTQVATVIPYFERFMQTLPTIQRLAAADESIVLRLWEGLGYYRRARQLHKAAQQIVAEHGGTFPDTLEDVSALPGIGRYTRGAVLSIAFDQRQPILEANTIRLNSRLLAYDGDTTSKTGQDLLWTFAADVLPRNSVGRFNQAMMELGSLVCTPKTPSCLVCPVASICPTRAAGLQESIPRAKRKTIYEERHETAVVVFKRNRVLLRRCQPGERWAGLWDFPRFVSADQHKTSSKATSASSKSEINAVQRLTGIEIAELESLATLKHGVTKYRITLMCHTATYVGGRRKRGCELEWVKPQELDEYPLSVTGRKIAKLL